MDSSQNEIDWSILCQLLTNAVVMAIQETETRDHPPVYSANDTLVLKISDHNIGPLYGLLEAREINTLVRVPNG